MTTIESLSQNNTGKIVGGQKCSTELHPYMFSLRYQRYAHNCTLCGLDKYNHYIVSDTSKNNGNVNQTLNQRM